MFAKLKQHKNINALDFKDLLKKNLNFKTLKYGILKATKNNFVYQIFEMQTDSLNQD